MKIGLLALLFMLLRPGHAQMITISGYVRETISGEAIAGVSVRESGSMHVVQSNEYGFFSLTIPRGKLHLSASMLTFESFSQSLFLEKDTSIIIRMVPKTLGSVEITEQSIDFRPSRINRLQLSLPELISVPVLMGEKDLIKSLTLTPGVSVGNEGSTGLLVRGGSPDQNLILLDDATVYNASHLFGFVSIFNTDAVKYVELYKGGFPARFGGRLSSVLDIKMKEGNRSEKNRRAGLGLISSRISLEGPLKYKNTSYMLTGRASYLGIIGLPVYLAYLAGGSESYGNYWLYDLNAKINHTFKDNSQLFVSFYHGFDHYGARERNSPESISSLA